MYYKEREIHKHYWNCLYITYTGTLYYGVFKCGCKKYNFVTRTGNGDKEGYKYENIVSKRKLRYEISVRIGFFNKDIRNIIFKSMQ